jgi:hypothetical protein
MILKIWAFLIMETFTILVPETVAIQLKRVEFVAGMDIHIQFYIIQTVHLVTNLVTTTNAYGKYIYFIHSVVCLAVGP